MALKDENQDLFVRYVLPYVFLYGKGHRKNETTICISDKGRDAHQVTLVLNKDTGTASISTRWLRQGNEVETNFHQLLDLMFDYIA